MAWRSASVDGVAAMHDSHTQVTGPWLLNKPNDVAGDINPWIAEDGSVGAGPVQAGLGARRPFWYLVVCLEGGE